MPRKYFYKSVSRNLEQEGRRWYSVFFVIFCLSLLVIIRWTEPPIVNFPAFPQPMFVMSAPPAEWSIRCMAIDRERKVIRPFWEDPKCIDEAKRLEQATLKAHN